MTRSKPGQSSTPVTHSPSPSTIIALISGDEEKSNASESDEYRPRASATRQRFKRTSKRMTRSRRAQCDVAEEATSDSDEEEDDDDESSSEEPSHSKTNSTSRRPKRGCRRATTKYSDDPNEVSDDDADATPTKMNGMQRRPKRSCRRLIFNNSDNEGTGSSDDATAKRPKRRCRQPIVKDEEEGDTSDEPVKPSRGRRRSSAKAGDEASNEKRNKPKKRGMKAYDSGSNDGETSDSNQHELPPVVKRIRRRASTKHNEEGRTSDSDVNEEPSLAKRRPSRQALQVTPAVVRTHRTPGKRSTSPAEVKTPKELDEDEEENDACKPKDAALSNRTFLNLKDLEPDNDTIALDGQLLPDVEPSVGDITNPFDVDEPDAYQTKMRDTIDLYRFLELPDFGGFSRLPIYRPFLNRTLWYMRRQAYKADVVANQHQSPTSTERRIHIRKWKKHGMRTPPPAICTLQVPKRRPDLNSSFSTNSTRSRSSVKSRSSIRSPNARLLSPSDRRLKPHRRSHIRVPPTIDFHFLRNKLALGGKPAVIECFLTSDTDGFFSPLKRIPSATFNMDVNVAYNHLEIDMPDDFCVDLLPTAKNREDYLVVQVTFRYEEVEVGEGRKLRNVAARQASQCERAALGQRPGKPMAKTAEQHVMFGALLVSSLSSIEGAEVQSGETTVVLCPSEELKISEVEDTWQTDRKLVPTILELSQRSSPRRGGIDEEYPCLRVEVQDGGADGFNESSDSESHRPTTDDERLRPTSSLATGPSGAGLLVKKRTNPIDVLVGAVFPDRFALQFQLYGSLDDGEPQRPKSIGEMQNGGRIRHRPSIISAIADSDSESSISPISDSDEESIASTTPAQETPSRALRKTPARITSGVVIKKEEILEALESREPSPPTPPPAPQQRHVSRIMNTSSRCFFCLSRSLRFPNMYAFLKHLMLCHPRFNFEYKQKIPVSKDRTLGGLVVTLNRDYDGSHEFDAMFHYVSNNTSFGYFPKRRLPSDPVYLVPRGSAKHMRRWWTAYSVELLEYDKSLPQHVCFGDGTRHMARFCFDQPTNINHKWMQQQTTKNLADITDLHYTERTFMCLWNKFLAEIRVTHLGHGMLYKSHRLFIKTYREAIQRNLLNAQWVCHLTVLQKEGQLTANEWYDLVRRIEPNFDPRTNHHHFVTREIRNLEKERWIAQQGGREKLKTSKASIDELWAAAEHSRRDTVDPTVVQSMDDLRRLYPFAPAKQLDEIWKYLEDYSKDDFKIQMPA
ncbi:polycomb protein suz12 [Aphelenchoides avenae]|nr:polycomb protein suz12 [Aphelenchus avenae]